MTTATSSEGEEARFDDADEWRAMRIVLPESNFEDNARQTCGLHISGEWQRRIERVEFNDPLVDVRNQLNINIPSKLMQRRSCLHFQNSLELLIETHSGRWCRIRWGV